MVLYISIGGKHFSSSGFVTWRAGILTALLIRCHQASLNLWSPSHSCTCWKNRCVWFSYLITLFLIVYNSIVGGVHRKQVAILIRCDSLLPHHVFVFFVIFTFFKHKLKPHSKTKNSLSPQVMLISRLNFNWALSNAGAQQMLNKAIYVFCLPGMFATSPANPLLWVFWKHKAHCYMARLKHPIQGQWKLFLV